MLTLNLYDYHVIGKVLSELGTDDLLDMQLTPREVTRIDALWDDLDLYLTAHLGDEWQTMEAK